MQYVRYSHIKSDSHNIPDAEIFTVYREDTQQWAFGMRINRNYTLTRFQDQRVDADGVLKAKKQIMFCKTYGWSYLGKKAWNIEVDDYEHEFMCLYCKKTTFDTSDPCPCRNIQKESLFKKTESGIILPF